MDISDAEYEQRRNIFQLCSWIDQKLISMEKGLFGSCRGKRMFFCLVLRLQKAMLRSHLMADPTENQGELICAVLMR